MQEQTKMLCSARLPSCLPVCLFAFLAPSNFVPLPPPLTCPTYRAARARGLDVVMVSPRASPPVVRLVEWSKVLFELQKRDKAAGKAKAAQARAAEAKEVLCVLCVCAVEGGC